MAVESSLVSTRTGAGHTMGEMAMIRSFMKDGIKTGCHSWFGVGWVLAGLALILPGFSGTAAPVSFSREILPILSENCFHFHGPDERARKGKLRLDTREGAMNGASKGAVLVPGQPEQSRLVSRIESTVADEQMPPPESNRTLTPSQKELIRRWVAEGAAWGSHWAFEAPVRPALPKGGAAAGWLNPIDVWVGTALKRDGFRFSEEADRATLLRRLSLDLTGLPPTPGERDRFVNSTDPRAYEIEVDRLLASPRYGERMAWEWLDASRYADSNGYQGDPTRTMWPWRDWLVAVLNRNIPFDRFTVLQIAGDLLPGAGRDEIIPTGFLRNHMINGEGGRIAEENRIEYLFDQTETVGAVWLGLTVTCARCHDHKYDPLTQDDYYSLFACFNNTPVTGGDGSGQAAPVVDVSSPEQHQRLANAALELAGVAAEVERLELSKFPRPEGKGASESPAAADLPGNIVSLVLKAPATNRPVDRLDTAVTYFKERDAEYAGSLERLRAATERRNAARAEIPKVMVMAERTESNPRETFTLQRGIYTKPERKVSPRPPAFLTATPLGEPLVQATSPRLQLARWLVDPANPLTARVTVNRVWQMFFGTGLVATSEDFGVQGDRPTHPELLDWLATEFVGTGWDVKRLQRLIVMSRTYRQSSKVEAESVEADPANRRLARGPRRRMPSWMIRDQALEVSGLRADPLGGVPVKPYQPPGIWEEATFGAIRYLQDHGEKLYRRSLYTFWRRIVAPTMFFDSATRQTCSVKTPRTNTPLHALATLNDVTYVEAARVLAQRLLVNSADDEIRLATAFRRILLRDPARAEADRIHERLKWLRTRFASDTGSAAALIRAGESPRPLDVSAVDHAAWTSVCLLLLNLDETLSVQ